MENNETHCFDLLVYGPCQGFLKVNTVIFFMFQMLLICHMPKHITLSIFYVKMQLGMQNKFLFKKLTLRRHLASSGLIVYVPGERRHSWRHCSGAGRTACSRTYRPAMKRDVKKRPYGFMFLSCAGRHRGQKMLKPPSIMMR